MCYIQGQTLGPGYVGREGCVYEGCTIIAASTFGAGSKFINCTFLCRRNFFGNCSSARSSVGAGSTMVGGYAEYVNFDSSGTWSGVANGGNTQPPSCVDCPPQTTIGQAYSGTAPGVVSTTQQTVGQTFCNKTSQCGSDGVIVHDARPGSVQYVVN